VTQTRKIRDPHAQFRPSDRSRGPVTIELPGHVPRNRRGRPVTERVYSSGLAGRLAALIGGVIAVPLAAVAIPLIGLREMLNIRNSDVLIAVCVGILVIGGLWVLLHVFVTGPIRFETDTQSVRLRRGLRITNEWQRASTDFASLVTRQSTNGIPSGSVRTIYATTAHERVEVPARWFGTARFNDLMADLAPLSTEAPSMTAGERAHTFELDPSASRLQGTRRSIVIVVLAGFLISLGAVAFFLVTDPFADPVALVFVAAVGILVALVVLIVVAAGRRRAARIPRSISVTTSTLQVGDQVLYYSQLVSIELTPPSYSGRARRLTVVEKGGTRTSYSLGPGASAVGVPVFENYAEFVEMLGRVAPTGVVRFDLR